MAKTEKAATAAGKLNIRKGPQQDRSQRLVANILESTRALLREARGTASKKITTTQIARRAGISVGSLYQYFPTTEAILYQMFKEMTAATREVLERFSSEEYLSLPRKEFINTMNRGVKSAESDSDLILDIISSIRVYPALAEAEREYAEFCADKLAHFMQHYGSTWPLQKLKRLGLHVFYVDFGTYMYREHASPPKKESLDWEVNILNFMLEQCFE